MKCFSRHSAAIMLLAGVLSPGAQQIQPSSQIASHVPAPSSDMSAPQLEEKGDALRAQKNYLDAMDYYRAGLKKSNTAVLHNKLGVCWIQQARYNEAKKEFEHAVKLDRAYAEAHNNLAVTYHQQKQYSSAIREYKRAIKFRDDNASFHANLGNAYFSHKDYEQAVKEFNRALGIDPGVFDPKPAGGVSLKLASVGDRAYFHYTMAKMYGSRGDMEHCRQYLTKASEEGYPYVRDALKDNAFGAVRKDPEFATFVRSLKPVPQTASAE
ncbi:MAG TPA: tetratricopeptide repeat protein [Candidatus Angelobacter sp.]|nr:tetratricopeptide repeat protein [Candidatus Angelobacter sp.]